MIYRLAPFSRRAIKTTRVLTPLLVTLASAALGQTSAGHPHSAATLKLIAPAVSTRSGLLLEPALDLSDFTREKFIKAIATIGPQNLHGAWSAPVEPLPLHPRSQTAGLTHDEVLAYMTEAKRLFDSGHAIPVADVGLISSQEHVNRQPMLNEIAAFSNTAVRVYVLVQKTLSSPNWSYFSIVQDLTAHPVRDYYATFKEAGPKFLGRSCYACHASGPLAIRPARPDLVTDPTLAAALDQVIAEQPRSQAFFPEHAPKPPTGDPLTLPFCARCHADDGRRDQLYQVQSHPIRVLVDFGYMPPDRRLKPDEIAQLKDWLDQKH